MFLSFANNSTKSQAAYYTKIFKIVMQQKFKILININ